MICSVLMFFCFSVYGICLIAINDTTPWKIVCCILGILYAAALQIMIHAGRK